MIPALDSNGHLPLGRYLCSISELRETFVDHERFAESTSRAGLFAGLLRYIRAWEVAQESVGGPPVLRHLWVAGSFASSRLNPDDVDVSPVVDGEVLDGLAGRPGVGKVKRLFEQRDRVVREFGVEPFRIIWRPVLSLDDNRVTPMQREYLLANGRYDDLWQRVRSQTEKGAFSSQDCGARRGYLEVTW